MSISSYFDDSNIYVTKNNLDDSNIYVTKINKFFFNIDRESKYYL